ncbi:hypothetical protein RIF29_28869 [Crotalaria pallida]|uniref:Uncharacterized protein n=1 Tax=Crotalaria pallida TaxID=3830 RepID=A0AAN9HVQ6_CROPI
MANFVFKINSYLFVVIFFSGVLIALSRPLEIEIKEHMTTNDNNVLSQIPPKAWINDFGATSSGPSPPGQGHSHPPGTTSSGPSPPGQGHSYPSIDDDGAQIVILEQQTQVRLLLAKAIVTHLEQQAQVRLLLVKAIVTHLEQQAQVSPPGQGHSYPSIDDDGAQIVILEQQTQVRLLLAKAIVTHLEQQAQVRLLLVKDIVIQLE